MAKLYFRYGAMNCGKTTALLQVAHNYEENNHIIFIIKSIVDIKGDTKIVSRLGIEREVDLLVKPNELLYELGPKLSQSNISCILVDESQFLSKNQVEDLWKISKIYDIPVICYGLRTDFKTMSFQGSARLFELADDLEELTTICSCGKKAKFNSRKIKDEYLLEGEQVIIDDGKKVEYEPLCGKCYIKKVLKY